MCCAIFSRRMYRKPDDERHLLASSSTTEPDISEYPRSIFLIIATEFCERFSFCGLRTILSLYLRNVLLFHENEATVVYHVFIMLCYFVPVAGAILADSYLGRFRTILYFSIIYAIGNIVMCIAATPPISLWPTVMTDAGLTMIALGTGGIKPCVAAFGGDQFHLPHQRKRLQQFFSIFYFTINFGGFAGMILTPILRKAFTCFGDDTCYAMGFGFPAALMLAALFVFLLGKPLYRLKYPKENITLNFISCIFYATRRKLSAADSEKRRDHWLDYAHERFSPKLIADTKIVLAVLFLYIPLPLFWSLYDQQGSRWTFQASRMNGQLLGTQLLPDQMQVINPAIVLVLIPLFDKCIYPLFSTALDSPLRRMTVGGIFAGLAFIASGLLELKLEEERWRVVPGRGQASLVFINTLGCDIGIVASFDSNLRVNAGEKRVSNVPSRNSTGYDIRLVAPATSRCSDVDLDEPTLITNVRAVEYRADTLILGLVGESLRLFLAEPEAAPDESLDGPPKLRVIFLRNSRDLNNVSVTFESATGGRRAMSYFVPDWYLMSESAYIKLEPGSSRYVVRGGSDHRRLIIKRRVSLESGAVYALILREHGARIAFDRLYRTSPSRTIHMFWLIPQYLCISIAEVMFAISGLEFSFTQAPKSMKTVTIAAWYVSVALGNLMVIIVTQARLFDSQAHEFFFFAGLILADMLVFARMVARYSFVALEPDSSLLIPPSCTRAREWRNATREEEASNAGPTDDTLESNTTQSR